MVRKGRMGGPAKNGGENASAKEPLLAHEIRRELLALGLLALYALVIALCFAISMRCANVFGRLLGMGITATFFFYVFINIAMVMGLVPVVGMPLPLISYGGSAMMTLLIGFGLVLSASVHRDLRIDRRGRTVTD